MKREVIVSGESMAVELSIDGRQVHAIVNERTYTLEAHEIRRGVYWFNWNGRSLEVVVRESSQGGIASCQGQPVAVELVDPRRRFQRSHASQEGVVEVRAPMPGKIVRVLRQEASPVDANEAIVVIEAMKMQNEVRSPKKGIVRSLLVAEGSAVNAGDSIALVE